jgi:hypothetical protein
LKRSETALFALHVPLGLMVLALHCDQTYISVASPINSLGRVDRLNTLNTNVKLFSRITVLQKFTKYPLSPDFVLKYNQNSDKIV